jgi:hypothetical protein
MCGRSTQRILGVTSEEETVWRSVEGLRLIIYLQEVTTLLSTCSDIQCMSWLYYMMYECVNIKYCSVRNVQYNACKRFGGW